MSEQGTFPTPSRRQKRRRRRFHRRRGGQRRSSSSSHRKLFLVIVPTTTTTSSGSRGNRPPSGGVQRSQRSHFFSFPKTKLSLSIRCVVSEHAKRKNVYEFKKLCSQRAFSRARSIIRRSIKREGSRAKSSFSSPAFLGTFCVCVCRRLRVLCRLSFAFSCDVLFSPKSLFSHVCCAKKKKICTE